MMNCNAIKLKQAISNPNDKHYHSSEYNEIIHELLENCDDGETLDALISFCIYYHREIILQKIIKENKFIFSQKTCKTSEYEPNVCLRIIDYLHMFLGSNSINFETTLFQSIKNKDYESVRKLLIFTRICNYNSEKMFRLAIKDLCMLEIFVQNHVYPNQYILLKLIRAGYISNTLYLLENYRVEINDNFILYKLYNLAVEKFKSHRLFRTLYKLYKLPKNVDLEYLLKENVDFGRKLKLEELEIR